MLKHMGNIRAASLFPVCGPFVLDALALVYQCLVVSSLSVSPGSQGKGLDNFFSISPACSALVCSSRSLVQITATGIHSLFVEIHCIQKTVAELLGSILPMFGHGQLHEFWHLFVVE